MSWIGKANKKWVTRCPMLGCWFPSDPLASTVVHPAGNIVDFFQEVNSEMKSFCLHYFANCCIL